MWPFCDRRKASEMGGVWRNAGYVATAMLVWLTGATLVGQTCGQDWWVRWLAARDARLEDRLARQQEMLDSAMEANRGYLMARVAKVIPVVFHVVWRTPEENLSDETILAVLEAMNRDFAGQNEDLWRVPEVFRSRIATGGIQFCLAGQDPSGNPSIGIIRVRTAWKEVGLSEDLYHTQAGGSDAWDPERYLNIWIADTGEFICGFGTYPGLGPMEHQGVVVAPECLRPAGPSDKVHHRTLVHEVGHYLGLRHVWDDNEDCTTDDGVADTPLQQHPYYGCPAHPQSSCGSDDLFMNFMDYVDDSCMVMFSRGQMERMLLTAALLRPGLGTGVSGCLAPSGQQQNRRPFEVFPNPAKEWIVLSFEDRSVIAGVLQLFDASGRCVLRRKGAWGGVLRIDLPELSPGIYLITWNETARLLVVGDD